MGSIQDDGGPYRDNETDVTILVTGFGPFLDKFPVNPSWEITKALPEYLPPTKTHRTGVRIKTFPAPIRVAYDDVRELVPYIHAKYAGIVDIVLHIGMASGRDYYSLERCAHRDGYQRHKDVDNKMPNPDQGEELFGDCPKVIIPSLDFDNIMLNWQCNVFAIPEGEPGSAADARPSEEAGRFLCEYIYFNSLAYFGRQNGHMAGGKESSRPVLFFHVPGQSDKMSLDRGQAVTQALLRAIADNYARQEKYGRAEIEAGNMKAAGVATIDSEKHT